MYKNYTYIFISFFYTMKTTKINVKGMHCNSCKLLLEKSLSNIEKIKSVEANFTKWTIQIWYEQDPDFDDIKNIVQECWYEVTDEKVKRSWLSKNIKDYKILLMSLLWFTFLYVVLKQAGIFSFNFNNSTPSLWLVLLIWLTAGFSTCMAIVGWLVLAISAKENKQNEQLTFSKKIIPHLRFNTWRIVWFGILWGILGIFGSVISVSPFIMSMMTLIIGIVMLLLGVNLTNISPKLSWISLSLPTWGLFIKKEKIIIDKKKSPTEWGKRLKLIISWGLTFFLPCGFTFAMQMYAIGTGNFWMGMIVMALFAIGTLPGLLSIGSLTSIFKGKKAQIAYQVIWVLVILFWIFNVSNAYGVLKNKLPSTVPQVTITDQNITTINMVYGEKWLQPTVLNLSLWKKYRIIVDVQVSIYSCLNTMYIPGLDENYKELKKWEKVEYTFDTVKAGEYPFVCATMGMSQGSKIIIK